MTLRLLTEEQEDEVARRYVAGETTRGLAAAFGCSTNPIFSALRSRNVTMRKGGPRTGDPARNRRFTSTQDREIAALYERGESIRVIAKAYESCPAAVHGALNRTGTNRRDGSPCLLFTPDDDALIAAAYGGGEGMEALARERDCSVAAIRSALRRRDVASRRSGQKKLTFTPEQTAQIVECYQSGNSQAKVAARFGVSQASVGRILRTNGVRTRMHARGPEAHGAWKGGRIKLGDYTALWVSPDDPMASMRTTTGYVLEHRLVMARHLGRPLTSAETVHHKDTSDRTDNRIENLQLRQGRHGKGGAFVCAECGSRNVVASVLAEA